MNLQKLFRMPRFRANEGTMQIMALGRLPTDVAANRSEPGPAPEYIVAAAEPTEEDWARERARRQVNSDAS
jgi:hypothetical protein